MDIKQKTIIALDTDTYEQAAHLVDILSMQASIFKVGIAPYTAFGDKILEKLAAEGKEVFLDLKIHDIPNTVKKAAFAAARKNVFMMNFHCSGGTEMLKAAREGAEEGAGHSGRKPILLGVTVLTSMDNAALRETGFKDDVEDQVKTAAALAKQAGLDGVVCSAEEATSMKEMFGRDFMTVTPGIRPATAELNDQKRVATPGDAFKRGADYIVIGRPVIGREDPSKALSAIYEETEKEMAAK